MHIAKQTTEVISRQLLIKYIKSQQLLNPPVPSSQPLPLLVEISIFIKFSVITCFYTCVCEFICCIFVAKQKVVCRNVCKWVHKGGIANYLFFYFILNSTSSSCTNPRWCLSCHCSLHVSSSLLNKQATVQAAF